ncbi:MAG: protein disulfide oxidoreductase [Gammaproteobacteria bacterium]|nr:protein disulfide oxidoreductase [Gammaproteobacteria bacterium]
MKLPLPSFLKIRAVKITIDILLILLVYLLLKTWLQRDMIEGPAPSINSQLLSNENFQLQSLQGKPVLLHFWASWCGICKMEQDSIEAISQDHTVISIAMKSGAAHKVTQYMKDHGLSFPTINDPDGSISDRYGVRAVPACFIISPDGKIQFKETGYTTEWGLRLRLWLATD